MQLRRLIEPKGFFPLAYKKNMVLFSFKVISKKGLFYIMYFLLYNPNLKSVFCGPTYKYVFFFLFFMFFLFVCLVRLGYFRLG